MVSITFCIPYLSTNDSNPISISPSFSFLAEVSLEGGPSLSQDPPLYEVFAHVIQAQFIQRLLGRDTVMIPPLELIIRVEVLLFHLRVSYLPMVRRRRLISSS